MKMKEIKRSIESDLKTFQNNLGSVNSFADLCKLYDLPNNGKQHKYFKNLIESHHFDISNWNWRKQLQKYEKVEKVCPVCQHKFLTKINHRDEKFTCSYICSGKYFKRHTEESRRKISESLHGYYLRTGKIPVSIEKKVRYTSKTFFKCLVCGKEKLAIRKTQRFCSNKCSTNYLKNDPIYLANLKAGVQKAIKEGRHVPWTSRKIVSYPERFFMDVLKNNNIEYKHNFKCGKYFIDFAIETGGKKIALEIDGKQHLYEDRRIKDKEKDLFLTNAGWMVYRIPWRSINTEKGKSYIKQQIQEFYDFYGKQIF